MENKRGKYRQKLIYASQWDTAFIELILMKTKSLNKFLWTFLVQNFTQIERKSGNRARFHLLPKLKYRFKLTDFSRNSYLLNHIMWKSHVSNFTQIAHEIWTVQVQIHSRP
jgi:hypothetical protein